MGRTVEKQQQQKNKIKYCSLKQYKQTGEDYINHNGFIAAIKALKIQRGELF